MTYVVGHAALAHTAFDICGAAHALTRASHRAIIGGTCSPQVGHHRGIGRAIELPYRALNNTFY